MSDARLVGPGEEDSAVAVPWLWNAHPRLALTLLAFDRPWKWNYWLVLGFLDCCWFCELVVYVLVDFM